MATADIAGHCRPTKYRYVFFCNVSTFYFLFFIFYFLFFIFYFLFTTKPTKAYSSQRRPTQVNAGPQHPTKANAGPRRRKRDRYVFFCNVHFIFYFWITTKPTKAHSSQRRLTHAHSSQRRQMEAHKE